MSQPAIRVENLSKQYQIGAAQPRYLTIRDQLAELARRIGRPRRERDDSHIWALKDVSFEVQPGEVLGIIGRNGAGKSTLLKILSRITEPTEGRAWLHGRVGSLLEVGTGFHPELTGRENIYFNGSILGMRRAEIERKFDEIVAFAEVEKFIDTAVKHYSSGMYMRLAFAVAAHLETEILLVDEVLAVGDADFQKKSLGKMQDVARGGRTVLFVSHDMGAINQLCSRCLLLAQGVLVGDGSTAAIIAQYLQAYKSKAPIIQLEPKSSHAYFTCVAVMDADDRPAHSFDVLKPLRVFLQFKLEQPIRGLEVSIAVFNHRMERIFYHSHLQNRKLLEFEGTGEHLLSVEIPGKLLPPGEYTINAALHIPQIELFDLREHILSFQIEETGSGAGKFPPGSVGSVLVDLSWKLESEMPQ